MRSITALLVLLFLVLSCGKRDQGELIGVKTKKFIKVNPHGMVEIPGGSFIMGSSDEDIIDVQNDVTRTMTIRTFYMDETEITNREYMQFIEWVKDSIVRTRLAEKSVYVKLGITQQNTGRPEIDQTWKEFNRNAEANVNEFTDGVSEIKMPNLDGISEAREGNNEPDDFYIAEKGEILEYFPDVEDYVGSESDDDTSAAEELSRLNGYQLLLRYRAENPIVLWLRDRNNADSLFHHHLPLNRDVEIYWERDEYPDIHYAEVMEDIIYLPEQDWYNGVRSINTKELVYRYSELKTDSLTQDMKNPQLVDDIKRSDYLIHDAVKIYPDTTVWIKDFKYSYNEPMFNEYFWHPAYANYPVVGVSWKQAKAFANWRTKYRNDYLRGEKNKTTVGQFRLPTEGEWEYAARGGKQSAIYPWGGPYLVDSRGDFLANFKPKRGDYAADNIVYTAEVDSYKPNDFGLYNMSGNVAEWTSSPYYNESYEFNTTFNPDVYMPDNERKVVRGGSWKDVAYYLKVGSRDYEYADSAKSYIGIRMVRDYLGSNNK
jgi:gliding motility-associated lipoprotein GldK